MNILYVSLHTYMQKKFCEMNVRTEQHCKLISRNIFQVTILQSSNVYLIQHEYVKLATWNQELEQFVHDGRSLFRRYPIIMNVKHSNDIVAFFRKFRLRAKCFIVGSYFDTSSKICFLQMLKLFIARFVAFKQSNVLSRVVPKILEDFLFSISITRTNRQPLKNIGR